MVDDILSADDSMDVVTMSIGDVLSKLNRDGFT